MPRPFAIIGTVFFTSLIILTFLGFEFAWLCLGLALAVFILVLSLERFKSPMIFTYSSFTVLIACLLFVSFIEISYKPVIAQAKKYEQASVNGQVIQIEQTANGKTACIIKGKSLEGEKHSFSVRLYFESYPEFEIYDRLEFRTKLSPINSTDKTLQHNYLSKNIFFSGSGDDVNFKILKRTSTMNPLKATFLARQKLTGALKNALPSENGSLVVAFIFGDTSHLTPGTIEGFRSVGAAHLVAVSGLHFSVFLHSLAIFLKRIRLGNKLSSLVILVFAFFFMALASFTPSVIRAGLMFFISRLALLFHRRSDAFNSLGIAVTIICLLKPMVWANVGLQLSFFASLGVISANNLYEKNFKDKLLRVKNTFYQKILTIVTQSVLMSFVVGAFTLPILMVSFGKVSILSAFTNLFITFLAAPTMIFGALAAVLTLVPGMSFATNPLYLISGGLSKYILWFSAKLAGLPISTIVLKHRFLAIWLAAVLLLFALAAILSKKSKKSYIITNLSLSIGLLLVVGISNYFLNQNTVSIRVLDNYNQSFIILNNNKKAAVLSCGGNSFTASKAKKHLDMAGAKKLDLLLLPQKDSYSTGAAPYLLRDYEPEKIILNDDDFQFSFLSEFANIETEQEYEGFLWDKVALKAVNNKGSSYCLIDIMGTRVLLVHKITKHAVEDLRPLILNADLVITRVNLTFKENEYSDKTVIFIRKNEFTLQEKNEYAKQNIKFLTTAGQGDIIVKTRGNKAFSLERGY